MTSLDIEQHDQLLAWLRDAGHVDRDEPIEFKTLAGGVSNRTVLVHRRNHDGDDWVIKQSLEKLRVKVDWFSDPARIRREASGMRWLEKIAPAGTITPLIFEDEQCNLLAMQAVPMPHQNFKSRLLRGDVHDEDIRQFGTLIGTIHARACQLESQRQTAAAEFGDRSFFESLRLEPYYSFAAAQIAGARRFLESLIDETRQTQLTIVHGDYSPKNILIHNDQLILLDHEVIHFGDPAFDIGFSLTHLLSKAHHVTNKRDLFAAAAAIYWNSYAEALGDVPWRDDFEPRAVRHTLGCLLARVAGRSPLEYLNHAERRTQQAAVIAMLDAPPVSVTDLIPRFLEAIDHHANH